MAETFDLTVRVYYEDTDAGGIVYHANFLGFCERGRTEYLRFLGFQNTTLRVDHELLFVVRSLTADYAAPAYLDDELTVRTALGELKNASFSLRQEIFRGAKAIFGMTVWLVCINLEGRPIRVPDGLCAALARPIDLRDKNE